MNEFTLLRGDIMFVYRIQSLLNHKSYIGITNDFTRRMREHKALHNPESLIDQAIQLDGADNFEYSIIDECDNYSELYIKERQYITIYNTLFPHGYNKTPGGDCLPGSENGNAKFSLQEITDIRNRFNSDENYLDIYNDYNRVGLGQFLKILRNQTYLDCPVRCKQKSLYNQGYLTKLKNQSLKFTRSEIEYFRQCWSKIINYKEIYQEYQEVCSKEYFYQVYYGLLYKDIMPEVFTAESKKKHSALSHSGESNSKAKLQAKQVLEARELYSKGGISYATLAKKYNVSAATMRAAIKKITWKNI